jgi:hypothetical protein
LERGNRGQGVKGVRLSEPTALVVGVQILRKVAREKFQVFDAAPIFLGLPFPFYRINTSSVKSVFPLFPPFKTD